MISLTHRPELHVTPETGILNAPAGVLFDGYTWHMFTQFAPRESEGSRWAHQVSYGSPFNWEICDDVLAPQAPETTLRAGSVTAVGDDVTLYYTGAIVHDAQQQETHIGIAEIPNIEATWETVSDEASTLDFHVIRHGVAITDQAGLTNFRSPCVVPNWFNEANREAGHEGWLMLTVTGDITCPGLAILESQDGKVWQLRGPLKLAGDSGLSDVNIVAPRIIRLRDEIDNQIYDVLIVTIEHNGIDISGYLVGTLSGTTFTITAPFKRLDYGHDFVRPRNTNRPSSIINAEQRYQSAVLFGLMNGVGRLDDASTHLSMNTEGWANCLSLPRRITLQGGLLYTTPFSGLPTAIEHSDYASMCTGIFDIPADGNVTIALYDTTGQVACTITHYGDRLELDRSMNPHHHGDNIAIAPLNEDDTDSLTIIVDASTVEVFADGGQIAMASRVYFNGQCEEFFLSTSSATVERFDKFFPRRNAYSGLDDLEGPVR
ncbi:sucrose-6-phosphate hydrolase [Corynebacterium kutscheri]|nr:GH32 C-terminal domain-containing protein [Corynebacterium kutscheri]VEH80117.1 sucrose-6-phosphate hydrolase [Corynebacterium kutscheri]